MSPTASTVLRAPGTGRIERFLGVSQEYRLESAESGGRHICVEITVPPGQGIPLHTHSHEDESFLVLQGQVRIATGPGVEADLSAGGFFHGPRGQPHGFRNAGAAPARLLVMISPGAGMQAMFGALNEAAARAPSGAIAPADVMAICAGNGIEFLPPG